MPETRAIRIGDRVIGPGRPCFVIAEIGINHGGDEHVAAALIEAAAGAGADAVKFQTVLPDESYQPGTDSYAAFQGSVLSVAAMQRLNARAESLGIVPFSTPGGFGALDLMVESGMAAIKISSGLLTNGPLIERAAATGLPLVLSTGMAAWDEVEAAIRTAEQAGAHELAVLQCTSLYPAAAETLNLLAMTTMAQSIEYPVGYSDHHPGHLAVVAAAALGANVIEKHFTLDAARSGADHAISAEPDAFANMVAALRQVEVMRGDGVKEPRAAERALRDARHRYLVAARGIVAGAEFAAEDIALLRCRPGVGRLPANAYHTVIGARARAAIAAGTALDATMIERRGG